MSSVDAVTAVPEPANEPVLTYAPGSAERAALSAALTAQLAAGVVELPHVIDGAAVAGAGEDVPVRRPDAHGHVLGRLRNATPAEVAAAVDAARRAAPGWRALGIDDRAAVLLRAAELLSGPWRQRLNAATMLGQSKTSYQAEIDSACELADFLRCNVAFARALYAEQPRSAAGVWNRTDHRPLEGFVLAITPFNFTAIAGNLPTAPALMGNTVVWKPSPTQALAAQATMELLQAAGLPPGVINLVHGDGSAVSATALTDPDLAGVHFTGSTGTFQHLWATVGADLSRYRSYPRLVGETGGKDFVLAHPSADPAAVTTALVRGAFEYQGQKCSAASRAYLPRSLWEGGVRDALAAAVTDLRYGDVTDFSVFGGAVIDARAHARLRGVLAQVAGSADLELLVGGGTDDRVGYFVDPTVVVSADPTAEVFSREYFGPLLAVHVYPDRDYPAMLDLVDRTSPYALTGALFATDRGAVATATDALRFAAGNFYINDKPTGAVVGQQPFGGGRASGTNDKAGSALNLLRWTSPRTIKETFVPPTRWEHPHMA